MIKLSDYIAKFVAEHQINKLFLLPGGGCMHMVNSFGSRDDIQSICCLHEQAAVIAADAYAQYTGKIGAALVTTGPGATNAITGVAGAWIDSVPVIVFSGQTKRQDMMGESGLRQKGIQEVDIITMVKSVTKYAVTVMKPERIKYHLEKAFYEAMNDRPGPVWLDVPLDVQGAMIDEETLEGFLPEPEELDHQALDEMAEKTIEWLNTSERPTMMVGLGVRLAGAMDEFYNLMDQFNIPVLTTWRAIDFLAEDHPLFFGRPGSLGQRYANFIQQNSDFFFVLGARLDLAQIGYYYENLAREAKKIVVDIDQAELDKLEKMNVDLSVCANAKSFIQKILDKKDKIQQKDRTPWFEQCKIWKQNYPVVLKEYLEKESPINTYVFIDVLSKALETDDLIVPGSSGSCSEILLQAFKVKAGQRIQNNPGLGSMGYGLPAALGAAVTSGKRTILVTGDGGLQHNIQELETIRRLNLPLKIFILNNNGYATIRNSQRNHFKGHLVCCDPSSGLTLPDICSIAKAYKLPAMKINSHLNLEEELKSVLEQEGPVVCEVMIDPDLITAPRLSSEVKPDGQIISKPMEDLWPFLDREEFLETMLVKPIEE